MNKYGFILQFYKALWSSQSACLRLDKLYETGAGDNLKYKYCTVIKSAKSDHRLLYWASIKNVTLIIEINKIVILNHISDYQYNS